MNRKKRYFLKDGIELNPDNVEILKRLKEAKKDYMDIWVEETGGSPIESITKLWNSLET